MGEAGIERVKDFNDPMIPAACTGLLDVVVDSNGRRQSTYHAFFPPEVVRKRRKHLKICTRAAVNRVQLKQSGDEVRATGVFFQSMDAVRSGQEFFAAASREVILCAGALVSPQILMLRYVITLTIASMSSINNYDSGLGPKDHLVENNITVVRDIPSVGSHLVRGRHGLFQRAVDQLLL